MTKEKKEAIMQEMIAHVKQNIDNRFTPALGTGLINILDQLLVIDEDKKKE